MFEYINGWEWFPLGLFVFAAIIMIAFIKDSSMPFFGIILLGMSLSLAYSTDSSNRAQAFVLKRFSEAHAIECGLWRGESTLVDPKANWKYVPAIGFVKGDQIHNDPGLCSVIAEESPQPSIVPYTFVFFTLTFIAFLLRHTVDHKEEEEDQEETREKHHEPL